jgi:cobyrinic acid a,c-diamide synthase
MKTNYLGVGTHPVIPGLLVILIQLFCYTCLRSMQQSTEWDTWAVLGILCVLAESFAFLLIKKKVIAFEESGIQVMGMWDTKLYTLNDFVSVEPVAKYLDLYRIRFADGRSYWFESDAIAKHFTQLQPDVTTGLQWNQLDAPAKAAILTQQLRQYIDQVKSRGHRMFGLLYGCTFLDEMPLFLDMPF